MEESAGQESNLKVEESVLSPNPSSLDTSSKVNESSGDASMSVPQTSEVSVQSADVAGPQSPGDLDEAPMDVEEPAASEQPNPSNGSAHDAINAVPYANGGVVTPEQSLQPLQVTSTTQSAAVQQYYDPNMYAQAFAAYGASMVAPSPDGSQTAYPYPYSYAYPGHYYGMPAGAYPQQVPQTMPTSTPVNGAQNPGPININPASSAPSASTTLSVAPKEEHRTPDPTSAKPSALTHTLSTIVSPSVVNSAWHQIPTAEPPKPVIDNLHGRRNVNATKMDKLQRIEQRIEADPWDTEAWTTFLTEANQKGDPQLTREAFEKFLKQFPTSARYWVSYADFEMRQKDNTKLEQIFTRCLRNIPDVDLCKFYLNYIRRRFSGGEGEKKVEGRTTVAKAYEFVVGNVGADKDSGMVWNDYLFFIKAGETHNAFEEGQKIDLYRRTFHRAVGTPVSNVELLWKEYDNWENQLNKLTAKKFLGDKSPAYMNARTALKELRTLMEPIEKVQKTWLPRPPQWTDKEVQVLDAWRRYIAWERSDPLKLGEKAPVASRVIYAYKRCLLMMRFYPQMWIEAAAYMTEVGKAEEGYNLLKTGTDAMPTCMSLHLHLAELYETQNKAPQAKQVYENLIANLEAQLASIGARTDAEKLRITQENSQQEDGDKMQVEGEEREKRRMKLKEQIEKVDERNAKEVEQVKRSLGLAWVFYMRFARRTEYTSGIFYDFADRPFLQALMEHYLSKDAVVAGKIFELGLKLVTGTDGTQQGSQIENGNDSVMFILQYLNYLISQNDENSENNTRALFERAIAMLAPSKARPVWDKFTNFESEYGDLNNLTKVEKRRHEAYPDDSYSLDGAAHLAQKYAYLDLDVVGNAEFGLQGRSLKGLFWAYRGYIEKQATPAKGKVATLSPVVRRPARESAGTRRGPFAEAEKYPRPDFSKWTPHKPLGDVKPIEARAPQETFPDRRAVPAPSLPPKPSVPSTPLQGTGTTVLAPIPLPGGGGVVPEPIASLMHKLPKTFTGPVLPADAILDLVRTHPQIAYPPGSVPRPQTANPLASFQAAGLGNSNAFQNLGRRVVGLLRSGEIGHANDDDPGVGVEAAVGIEDGVVVGTEIVQSAPVEEAKWVVEGDRHRGLSERERVMKMIATDLDIGIEADKVAWLL
ncbi:mRNA 3'-end-processing protein rna14 [Gonapodya sp. JEL0774]|nr:mRNA 3'-end-processing protein rna14 [Gonapodya sp. JEL0774]